MSPRQRAGAPLIPRLPRPLDDLIQLMANWSLEIIEGPGAGRHVALDGPTVIGRDPDADLVLDDTQVSRHHARVTSQPDGSVSVEDLGSTNGSFINQMALHGPTRLELGDELLVGVTVFELRQTADIARRPSTVRPVPPALAAPQRVPTFLDSGHGPEAARWGDLERLTDARTRLQARTAPLAIAVLVALVVAVYLGSR